VSDYGISETPAPITHSLSTVGTSGGGREDFTSFNGDGNFIFDRPMLNAHMINLQSDQAHYSYPAAGDAFQARYGNSIASGPNVAGSPAAAVGETHWSFFVDVNGANADPNVDIFVTRNPSDWFYRDIYSSAEHQMIGYFDTDTPAIFEVQQFTSEKHTTLNSGRTGDATRCSELQIYKLDRPFEASSPSTNRFRERVFRSSSPIVVARGPEQYTLRSSSPVVVARGPEQYILRSSSPIVVAEGPKQEVLRSSVVAVYQLIG
jgi:hypothetical protein